ncbi:pseudouridine-5'-phosphate glycosidase [Pseudonocardia oroxyli]|uniref:Pseudouridine-5'-phosphate glycosidase n=1 Tax=Pseudonocardia oroxyli TaxID=366584 RepID=A0A1G7DXD3_PSEOR|nr:pseudouridine-5'-phosphate glycosidase [Pseudonocardia oroxyli]SDE56164.1 pseudouridine-5'-phosphate glycosidase [Pseudonocardia oroxyli]
MPHVAPVDSSPVCSPAVAEALAAGTAVVALESTILAHGLPAPRNRATADELEAEVRALGAVPATIAVLDGRAHVGLDARGLDRVCTEEIAKLSVRDLGVAAGLGLSGATTVAATAHLAAAVGIAVFATGGLGGVHRGARETWDVSADLAALATTPVLTVCSGVKSILDVGATLEVLETSSVPVLGYRTDRFPGFYRRDSGFAVPWRVESPDEAARVWAAHTTGSGMVLARPVPDADELDAALHDRLLAEGLALVEERGVTGKDVTPALLEHFHTASGGASLATNVSLVRANARLAARVAVALTCSDPR